MAAKKQKLEVELKASGASQFKSKLNKSADDVENWGKRNTRSTRGFTRSILASNKTLGVYTGTIGAVVAVSWGLFRATKSLITASNTYENSLTGLKTVSVAFGVASDDATKAAESLAEDGLLTVAEAAKSLKNLLSKGFNLPQSIKLMERFKDTAAFGRQGALGFGEAIVGATEGLKNDMSVKVDNAGITENLSIMWKRFAKELGVGVKSLTEAQKRQASFNGIMRESEPMLGDAAKLTGLYTGKVDKLRATWLKFAASWGDKIKPALGEMIDFLSGGLEIITAEAAATNEQRLNQANQQIIRLSKEISQIQTVTLFGKTKELFPAEAAVLKGNLLFFVQQKINAEKAITDKTKTELDAKSKHEDKIRKEGLTAALKNAEKILSISDKFHQKETDSIIEHIRKRNEAREAGFKIAADFRLKFAREGAEERAKELELDREVADKQFEISNDIIDKSLENRRILREAAEAGRTQELLGAQIVANAQRLHAEKTKKLRTDAINTTISNISNMANIWADKSRAMFRISQAAAIAQASMNVYEGITKALTLPFPLSFAVASSTALLGFAQVAHIASTSFGGGSAAAGGGAPKLSEREQIIESFETGKRREDIRADLIAEGILPAENANRNNETPVTQITNNFIINDADIVDADRLVRKMQKATERLERDKIA